MSAGLPLPCSLDYLGFLSRWRLRSVPPAAVGAPAELRQLGPIEELLRCTVRARGVENKPPAVADNIGHELREFCDRAFRSESIMAVFALFFAPHDREVGID